MRADEDRAVDSFCAWLEDRAWTVERGETLNVVIATHGAQKLRAVVKGRSTNPTIDVDAM
jgi:hypothetical protein